AIYEYASSPTSETMALSLCIVSVCMALGILFLHEVLGKKLSQRR
ncbi:MAG: molybdate transporter, inner rane subunit, partial [Deltaproteobacteria bacterium]|nr:molybdate transporter, inner rane subunit [Deltaproteobacteria bacterium]